LRVHEIGKLQYGKWDSRIISDKSYQLGSIRLQRYDARNTFGRGKLT